MPKYKRMNQKEFDQIKAMLNAGIAKAKTAEFVKRSSATVATIASSKDFADYLQIMRQQYEKRLAKQKTNGHTEPTTEAMDNHNSTISVLKAIEFNQQKMIALLTNMTKKATISE